jgi:predicted Zn-dependent peptidase
MDEQRYALGIMNTILGGGMSSRLYQEIREDRGLAYSTYSYQHGYSDAGFFGMYAGCNPENAPLVVDLMRQGLDGIAQSGVTDHEFELALGNITGGLALRFEGTLSRMNRLMGAELGSGEWLSVEQVLERFRAVTKEEVQQVAQRISAMPSTLVAVGSSLGPLAKRA